MLWKFWQRNSLVEREPPTLAERLILRVTALLTVVLAIVEAIRTINRGA
jgi:hypothetical protein